ncbi:30S ribosomal protein S6 [Candidatus Roizmanbacteria bacterium CG22_combo_CG10-13_8_21_14_all_35_9]|nr:MAG: 30S ribosomal protein S6 [Candidatus Roizmanbacteria bacterium CG22_combo_CG10-13_8_21_14_all_35_9]PJC82937.1 MAG: 30S ribosomal protein S6 [Candidatus Roizmanbacteria bacterium CG_4_8_14_3_um_filter_35_14]
MKYELTFLLNEEAELIKLKELVESLSGKISGEEKWGEKTLAYPIKKNRTVHFYQWQIEIEKKNILELRKKLNFNEKIIRYLLLVKE